MIPTLDGGYAVAGYTFGYGATDGDAFLMKLTASGAISWFRRYGNGRYQYATDLVQMPDSTYWLTGTSSTGGFVDPNIFLVHTNKNGVRLSAQEFGSPMRTERANSMIVAPDGGLLIGGEVSNCPLGDFQALFMRTTPGGHCPGCDSLNVVYTSSAHTPTILTGFTLTTAGTSNVVGPLIQAVSPATTWCSGELMLPVQLISFAGEADGLHNVLYWTTATEHNNDRFEIERSSDASTWELVATIPAAGNSQQRVDYQAIDRFPLPLNYYRLRQVDLDGTATFSAVIALENARVTGALEIFPNPGNDHLILRAASDDPIQHVELSSADGRIVLRKVDLAANERVYLDVAQLPTGTYFVRVTSESGMHAATWVKLDR